MIIVQAERTAMFSPAVFLITSSILRPFIVPFITDPQTSYLSHIHHQSLRPLDKFHQDGLLTLSGESETSTGVSPMSAVIGGGSESAYGASGSPEVRLEDRFTSESPCLLIYPGRGAIDPVEGSRRWQRGRVGGLCVGRRSEPSGSAGRTGRRWGRWLLVVVRGK